jgi:DNA helicase-2/ATP-dependent DNA helicase PcrA
LLANPGTAGLPEPIRIADDWERKRLIHSHLRQIVGCNVNMIQRCEVEMASNWEGLTREVDPSVPDDVRAKFVGAWDQHRRVFGYSLLAELPFRLLRALEDHPDLDLGGWDYLVVDEYQDLNRCDLRVLQEISGRGRVLIAAGDDDQSIYSFRKAHPAGIQQFPTDYAEADDYTLTTSQRCGRRILSWANHVISGLPGRLPRPALASAPHCGEGETRYLRFDNWDREAEGVARLVAWLIHDCEIAPEDIAVMFRTNHNNVWSTPLAAQLIARGVPVVNPDEVKVMLAEPNNRRMLAVARLVANREDSLAWWTLLELADGIGDAVRNHFYERAASANTTFSAQLLEEHRLGYPDLATRHQDRLRQVVESVLPLLEEVEADLADLGETGWGQWMVDRADVLGTADQHLLDLLVELDEHVDRTEGLGRFIGQIQPVGKDLRSGRPAQAIRLMTMASSKGLTVRVAIVVGVEEGIIPRPGEELGEERRLLYVAMTRATEYLYLTWSGRRTGPTARAGRPWVARGRNRSPFLTHGPVASEDGEAYLGQLGV